MMKIRLFVDRPMKGKPRVVGIRSARFFDPVSEKHLPRYDTGIAWFEDVVKLPKAKGAKSRP